jgi:hypothetical protein
VFLEEEKMMNNKEKDDLAESMSKQNDPFKRPPVPPQAPLNDGSL